MVSWTRQEIIEENGGIVVNKTLYKEKNLNKN